MAATTLQSFPNSDVKLRFGEPYVSDGLNAKFAGIIPRGIYRGYALVAGAAPLTAQLDPDANNRHLAIYETLLNRSLTLTRSGGPISVPLAAFAGTTVYVVIFAEYTTSSPTVAELRVYSVADFNSAPEKDELVVLGVVDVPGAGVIPDSAISTAQATYPWKEGSSLAFRPWNQVVRNGSFDDGQGSVATPSQTIPGFSGQESGTALVQVNDALGRDGTPGLLMQITGVVAIGRLGPGQFDITKPLSGGVVPVQAGQLVDVSLYLAGGAVKGYSAGTSGLRCILSFYNLAGVLQGTEQVESDPTVHIGTFSYTQLSEVFAAPSVGYFTWYLEASIDLVGGTSQFFVDDLRIFVQPRATPQEDGDVSTSVPAIRALRLDLVPDNAPDRFTENFSTARLAATIDADSATVIALSKAGMSSLSSEMPRMGTPLIFKGVDLDYSGVGFGVMGTESTADQDAIPHEYKLLKTFRSRQADETRIRMYVRTTPNEYVITSNARWGGGSSQLWHPDDTTYDALKFTVGNNGVRWESRDSALPATWADSAWTGTVGAGDGLLWLLFGTTLRVDMDDATQALLSTTKLPGDHPAVPGNLYKLVMGPFLAAGARVRVYFGSSTFGFMATLNAFWDPATARWASDDATKASVRWSMAATSGTAQVRCEHRNATGATWVDNAWSNDTVTDGFGDYRATGEYKYVLARTRTVLVPLQNACPDIDHTTAENQWRPFESAGVVTWVALVAGARPLYVPLNVPHLCSLTRARIMVNNASANAISAFLESDTAYDFTTPPGTIVHTVLDSDTTPAVATTHVITLTPSPTAVDRTDSHYYVEISPSAGSSDLVLAVEIQYTELRTVYGIA